MYISEETIAKIKDATDIVDLIGSYISLKKRGQSYVGLCPFHGEKTPSFTVTPSLGIFKCFGCGEAGDVIGFLMKYENLEFNEAVKVLADRARIPLEETRSEMPRTDDKYYEIHREAAYFYLDQLSKSELAMNYLKERNISPTIAKRFGLGYAPDSWSALKDYLLSKSYSENDLLKANLIGRSENTGNTYDLFRSRLIFPIIDLKKRVCGFSGRIIGDGEPKYYNSRDSLEFTKGNMLFGLNLVQQNKNRDKIMLVEGNIDVVKLHQMGINYVVAALGTAFTERQAQLLKRFGNEVYLCLDGDAAGQKATLRDIEILQNQGVSPKIIEIPGGLDPDDFINKYGVNEFKALQFDAKAPFDFVLSYSLEGKDLTKHEDFINFVREVIAYIKKVPDPISRDVYIKTLAKEYDISLDAINEEFKTLTKTEEDSESDFTIPRAENKWPRLLINVMLTEKANALYMDNHKLDDYLPDNKVKNLYQLILENYETKDVIDLEEFKKQIASSGKMDANNLFWLKKLDLSAKETEKMLSDIYRQVRSASESKFADKIVDKIDSTDNIEDAMKLLEELDNMHERK